MANTFYLLDKGLRITIIVTDAAGAARDISAASGVSDKQFVFTDPDGAETTKDGIFTTDGTDGSFYYVIEDSFLASIGDWCFRGKITESASTVYRTGIGTFTVVA